MNQAIRRAWNQVRAAAAEPYPVKGCSRSQRQGMKWLWWDSIFSTASAAFYIDFVSLYMLQLGAQDYQIGVLSSIASAAGMLAPSIGAWLVEKTRKRKLWVLVGPGGVFRVAFFFLAALPFVMHGSGAVSAFIVLYTLQAFAAAFGIPAGNSLFADIVPIGVRGRFLGNSLTASYIARLAVVPFAGVIIQAVGGLRGYQLVWLLAGLTGFIATSFYARVPEPPSPEGKPSGLHNRLSSLSVLKQDSRFLYYCLVTFVWNFGIQLAGPYFSAYQLQVLGFSVDTIAFILTISSLVAAIMVRIAGELMDRLGTVKMMGVSMALVPFIPVLWLFGRTPPQITLTQCFSEVAWAGFRVAGTPLLLLLAPPEQRSRYIAASNTITNLALVLGPLPAGWIYASYGFHTNLILSAVGRLLAAIMFFLLATVGGMRNLDALAKAPDDAPETDLPLE